MEVSLPTAPTPGNIKLKLKRKDQPRKKPPAVQQDKPTAPPPIEAEVPLPDDPWECVRELARVRKQLDETSDPGFKLTLKDRIRKLRLHVKEQHPDVWSDLLKQSGQAKPPPVAADASVAATRKPPRQTKQDHAEARQRLLKLSLGELLDAVTESADKLIEYLKAPDNYGVLMLRLIMQLLQPDTTAALVLSQLLFWKCRRKDGRIRVGKQNWLRKTHADLAAETGLTVDQVTGSLGRLAKLGLCDKDRGCRTGLLEPNLPVIASRAWALLQSEQGS